MVVFFYRFPQWHVVQRYQLGDVILISYAGINVKNGRGWGWHGHRGSIWTLPLSPQDILSHLNYFPGPGVGNFPPPPPPPRRQEPITLRGRLPCTRVTAFSWTSSFLELFLHEFWISSKFHKPVSKTYRPKNDIFWLLITLNFLFWYLILRMRS